MENAGQVRPAFCCLLQLRKSSLRFRYRRVTTWQRDAAAWRRRLLSRAGVESRGSLATNVYENTSPYTRKSAYPSDSVVACAAAHGAIHARVPYLRCGDYMLSRKAQPTSHTVKAATFSAMRMPELSMIQLYFASITSSDSVCSLDEVCQFWLAPLCQSQTDTLLPPQKFLHLYRRMKRPFITSSAVYIAKELPRAGCCKYRHFQRVRHGPAEMSFRRGIGVFEVGQQEQMLS
jgi:hypothetical protein